MINKEEAANSMSLRGQRKVHLKDLYAIVDWLCTGTKDEPAEERMEDNGHVDADTQTRTHRLHSCERLLWFVEH